MTNYGYDKLSEFIRSFFRPDLLKSKIIMIGTIIGSGLEVAAKVTNNIFGITGWLFIMLMVILFFEFFTGIRASLKEYKETKSSSKKFTSKKINGGGLKAMVWLLFIASFWALSNNLNSEWLKLLLSAVHGFVVVFVFASYIVSIGENMVRLGHTEFNWLVNITKKKIMKNLNDN